jgi:hypothetical protein
MMAPMAVAAPVTRPSPRGERSGAPILFGLDYPQTSLEQAANAVERLGLNASEKAKIRFENARKLLSLTARRLASPLRRQPERALQPVTRL